MGTDYHDEFLSVILTDTAANHINTATVSGAVAEPNINDMDKYSITVKMKSIVLVWSVRFLM